MAFLRALGIPCRLHGFAIDKKLQKGAIYGIFYKLSPQEIIHSWVEVFYDNKWINLEGFIIDNAFLNKIQCMFPQTTGEFCGYGIATKNLKNPPVEWTGGDTYIQKEGIVKDFGLFNDPDEYYQKYHNLKGLKKFLFENIVRHFVNANVEKIRSAN